jgi:hypothetical protein
MNEFKGTPGPWKVVSDSPEGSEIESEHESPFWAFVSYDTPEAERTPNAKLIAAAPELLQALQIMLDDQCPLTGNPTRERLIEHWQYELEQGNGYAENALFALRTVAKALGEKP